MVELVRPGRDADDLAHEFDQTAQSIRNGIARADQKDGRQGDAPPGLSAIERDELLRLRRENRQIRVERDIPSKVEAWLAPETGMQPPVLPVHEHKPAPLPGCHRGAGADVARDLTPDLRRTPICADVESDTAASGPRQRSAHGIRSRTEGDPTRNVALKLENRPPEQGKPKPIPAGPAAGGLLLADAGCDSDRLRRLLLDRGTLPLIPNNPTRTQLCSFDEAAYQQLDLIERVSCRPRDWSRVAKRYDKLANNLASPSPLSSFAGSD